VTGSAAEKKNNDATQAATNGGQGGGTTSGLAPSTTSTTTGPITFKKAMAALLGPSCIAVRPCGKNSSSYLEQWNFGIYTTQGMVLIVTDFGALTIFGLAFSTGDDLRPEPLQPQLYGYSGPPLEKIGAQWWVHVSWGFPLKLMLKGKEAKELQKVADVNIEGQFFGHVSIAHQTDLAVVLTILTQTGSVEGLEKYVKNEPCEFQIAGSLAVTFTFDLAVLFGKHGQMLPKKDQKQPIHAGEASWLVDAKYDPLGASYIAYYLTAKLSLDLRNMLKVTGFLEKLMPDVKIDSTFGVMIKLMSGGKVDFKISFSYSKKLECGEILKVLADSVHLSKICGWEDTFNLTVAVKDNILDLKSSCFSLDREKVCLSQLPVCPAPRDVGDSCSKDSYCTGDGFEPSGKGYCSVSLPFCQGTCMREKPSESFCQGDDECDPGLMCICEKYLPPLPNPIGGVPVPPKCESARCKNRPADSRRRRCFFPSPFKFLCK